MSKILHMETDHVRSVADQMSQASDEIIQALDGISGAVQSVDWSGPGRDSFVAQFSRVARTLSQQAKEGQELGKRLQQESNEWESLAIMGVRNGGGLLGGLIGSGGAGGNDDSSYSDDRKITDINLIDAWDTLKAEISTLGLLLNNSALKGVSVLTGAFDFFLLKLPQAEEAFSRWEEYNRQMAGWDSTVAAQYEFEAKKALDDLGLAGIKDILDTIVDFLPKTGAVQSVLGKIYNSLGVFIDWTDAIENN